MADGQLVNLIIRHELGLNPKPSNSDNRESRGRLKRAIHRHIDTGKPGMTALAERVRREHMS